MADNDYRTKFQPSLNRQTDYPQDFAKTTNGNDFKTTYSQQYFLYQTQRNHVDMTKKKITDFSCRAKKNLVTHFINLNSSETRIYNINKIPIHWYNQRIHKNISFLFGKFQFIYILLKIYKQYIFINLGVVFVGTRLNELLLDY